MSHERHLPETPRGGRRRAGASTLELPVLGVGCWSFGGGAYWGAQSQHDVDAVVARALDLGLNYFDTAEVYNDGASERSLGMALRGRRDRAVIGTKLSPHHAYGRLVREYCEASLRRLQTEWIDLYMLHWPLNASALRHFTDDGRLAGAPPEIGEALGAMDALRREGKIRHIGVSNFGVVQLREALATGVPLAINQVPYNLLMRAAEFDLFSLCGERGVGVLAYEALMQGILARRVDSFDGLPAARLRTRHFASSGAGSRHGEAGIEPSTLAALDRVAATAASTGASLATVALAWVMARPEVTCTLVGSRNLAQLAENAAALDLRLTSELRARLAAATDDVKTRLGPGLDYYQSREDSRSW